MHFSIANSGLWSSVEHSHDITRHLIERNERGPNAGEADWKSEMSVDLSQIKYDVQEDKKNKKTGERKKLSPEDQFMMASV